MDGADAGLIRSIGLSADAKLTFSPSLVTSGGGGADSDGDTVGIGRRRGGADLTGDAVSHAVRGRASRATAPVAGKPSFSAGSLQDSEPDDTSECAKSVPGTGSLRMMSSSSAAVHGPAPGTQTIIHPLSIPLPPMSESGEDTSDSPPSQPTLPSSSPLTQEHVGSVITAVGVSGDGDARVEQAWLSETNSTAAAGSRAVGVDGWNGGGLRHAETRSGVDRKIGMDYDGVEVGGVRLGMYRMCGCLFHVIGERVESCSHGALFAMPPGSAVCVSHRPVMLRLVPWSC